LAADGRWPFLGLGDSKSLVLTEELDHGLGLVLEGEGCIFCAEGGVCDLASDLLVADEEVF
jgi:hypothetical protein